MDTHASSAARILIVTDITTDATLVKNLLSPEFDHVFTTTDPDKLAGDFVRYLPGVLVLAFNSLEKSERHYLGLYRLCTEVHQHPHRTLILCSQDEMRRAYELCRKEYFDDYILFWPMTQDTLRLPMSIHRALRELAAPDADEPSANEFAAKVRHFADMAKTLDRQITQGGRHAEASSRAMELAEQKVNTALDGFSQRLIDGGLPDSVEVKNPDGLKKEISRLKWSEIQQYFRAANESAQPLKQWASGFKQECAPLVESARTLNAMAERIRPIVLVVDDDELQHKIIAKILEAENYHLVFATGGLEALGILRKMRPDLVLMDVMMPGMDGIETTRHLKAMPQFAKTPVVMVTGDSEGKVVIDSLKAGASGFVVKPFERATLIAKIGRALNATTSS